MILCVFFKISFLELILLIGCSFILGCIADRIKKEIKKIMEV